MALQTWITTTTTNTTLDDTNLGHRKARQLQFTNIQKSAARHKADTNLLYKLNTFQ